MRSLVEVECREYPADAKWREWHSWNLSGSLDCADEDPASLGNPTDGQMFAARQYVAGILGRVAMGILEANRRIEDAEPASSWRYLTARLDAAGWLATNADRTASPDYPWLGVECHPDRVKFWRKELERIVTALASEDAAPA